MVTHSLAVPVPVPGKRVAACSAAQPKRWSCVAGRRDASTKSTSLYSSPRLPPWAWKVMMLTNHHHRFCWRERGGCTLWFFVDTFGKHGIIFIHDGPCCYRCFSNGAIFPDYSYESMDLRILRYGEIGRQPFAGWPEKEASVAYANMIRIFPAKKNLETIYANTDNHGEQYNYNHICNHILWILHKHWLTVDHEGWWCSSHIL